MPRRKKVTIYSISGAITSAFKHHIKPILKEIPNEVIIHGWTNDLTKYVTNSVDSLYHKWNKEMESEIKIAIHGIIQRGHKQWLNEKIGQINKYLEQVTDKNGSISINNDTYHNSY